MEVARMVIQSFVSFGHKRRKLHSDNIITFVTDLIAAISDVLLLAFWIGPSYHQHHFILVEPERVLLSSKTPFIAYFFLGLRPGQSQKLCFPSVRHDKWSASKLCVQLFSSCGTNNTQFFRVWRSLTEY